MAGTVTVPWRGPPQTVAVKVSPTSGSSITEHMVTGTSSGVVTSGRLMTGGSFTGVIVMYTCAVSQSDGAGMPLSQIT